METAICEVVEPASPMEEEGGATGPEEEDGVVLRGGGDKEYTPGKPVQRSLSDRYSYRAAIYKNEADMDLL